MRTAQETATSLRNFRESQACTSLEVDILGVDQDAQCLQRCTREKVGLSPLRLRLSRCIIPALRSTYVLQILKQIGYSFSFGVGQCRLIESISRAAKKTFGGE